MVGRLRVGIIAFVVLVVSALTACGQETASDSRAQSGGTEEATPRITTADSSLGTVLVDGDGRTLYLFTKDSPGKSACEGECLSAWPILTGAPTAGDGVNAKFIGTITRSDGTVQATYHDWPLYYFAKDAAPGDVNGQGVNGVWFVVSPAGKAIQKAPATSGSGTGY